MAGEDCFLGIDVGTSGTKVLAVAGDGAVRARASQPHALSAPRPGWVEQDPAGWWMATRAAVRAALAQLPGGPGQVAGVGLSGHMSSLVCLGENGEPTRPCMVLSDTRAEAEASWLDALAGSSIETLCGARPSAAATGPRILWVQRHEPDVYARTKTFVFAKDYVRLRLTGQLASEPTDAGNTMLLDLRTGDWDMETVAAAGIDRERLPELVPTTSVIGGVTAEAAEATGLRTGTPVVAGAADMAAAVTGSGATRPGVLCVTLGTAAPVTTVFGEIPPGAAGRVTFHPHALPGWLYSIGSIFAGGLSLRWVGEAVGEEGVVGPMAELAYEHLSAEAARATPGSDGVLFLPYLVGAGSPRFDPAMRGTYLGLSLASSRAEMVRAVMEGVAYNVRECIDVFRELGAPVERIHVGGGGAASPVWLQILADVLGRSISPVAERDVSALGAAALAAVGLQRFSDVAAAAESMVRLQDPVPPSGRDAISSYELAFRAFGLARAAVEAFYNEMNGLTAGEEAG